MRFIVKKKLVLKTEKMKNQILATVTGEETI